MYKCHVENIQFLKNTTKDKHAYLFYFIFKMCRWGGKATGFNDVAACCCVRGDI